MAGKAIVIAHGEMEVTPEVREAAERADLIVAADGGAAAAVAQGWWPDILVGDLDSVTPEMRALVVDHGARVQRHSPRKDETDTELALRAALAEGAHEITLLGATGGRLDHALANILLLAMDELAGARITLLAGRQRLFVIRGRAEIRGRVGDLVSLLPIGGDAAGIRTAGLEYALGGETLRFGIPRGISNVFTAPVATVELEEGILLAVVTPS